RIDATGIAYVQRASGAVILGSAALLVLRFLEVGQDVSKAPAGISQLFPLVIILAMAADIDHGVERTAAAQDLASRPEEFAIFQLRLSLSVVGPIAGCLEEFGECRRNMDFAFAVGTACFQQQHFDGRIFAETVGEHASGRTGADDYVVVHSGMASAQKL